MKLYDLIGYERYRVYREWSKIILEIIFPYRKKYIDKISARSFRKIYMKKLMEN